MTLTNVKENGPETRHSNFLEAHKLWLGKEFVESYLHIPLFMEGNTQDIKHHDSALEGPMRISGM